jgi:hypothetical protein
MFPNLSHGGTLNNYSYAEGSEAIKIFTVRKKLIERRAIKF